MDILEFAEQAKKQDKRNIFSQSTGQLGNIPLCMQDFYLLSNPIDVEIQSRKLGNVRFYPKESLSELHKQYNFFPDNIFIFATAGGDPIFLENSKVYISYESEYSPEFLANTFEDFLKICFI